MLIAGAIGLNANTEASTSVVGIALNVGGAGKTFSLISEIGHVSIRKNIEHI